MDSGFSKDKKKKSQERESAINMIRKSVSYNLRQARQELNAFWASYQPVNQGTKVVDQAYKNEIQQFVKVSFFFFQV